MEENNQIFARTSLIIISIENVEDVIVKFKMKTG